MPEPSGACTSPANTVRSSEAPATRVAVEAKHVRRGVDRMRDEAARDDLHRVQAIRERRHDAEVAAAAAQRPEQVGIGRLGHLEHVAVGVDELDARAGCRRPGRTSPSASRVRRRASAPRCPVVEIAPPVTARPCAAVASLSSAQLSPPSARTVRAAGSTSMPFISARSIITPPSATARPATLWPPPRTRDVEPGGAREAHARSDVGSAPAADDDGGRAVDKAVVDTARSVVGVIPGAQDAAGDLAGQIIEQCGVRSHGGHTSDSAAPLSARRLRVYAEADVEQERLRARAQPGQYLAERRMSSSCVTMRRDGQPRPAATVARSSDSKPGHAPGRHAHSRAHP